MAKSCPIRTAPRSVSSCRGSTASNQRSPSSASTSPTSNLTPPGTIPMAWSTASSPMLIPTTTTPDGPKPANAVSTQAFCLTTSRRSCLTATAIRSPACTQAWISRRTTRVNRYDPDPTALQGPEPSLAQIIHHRNDRQQEEYSCQRHLRGVLLHRHIPSCLGCACDRGEEVGELPVGCPVAIAPRQSAKVRYRHRKPPPIIASSSGSKDERSVRHLRRLPDSVKRFNLR